MTAPQAAWRSPTCAETSQYLRFGFERHARVCSIVQRVTRLAAVADKGASKPVAFWQCANGAGAESTFAVVDTAQITLSSSALRDSTLVTVSATSSKLADTYDSYVIFHRDSRQGPFRFGEPWRCPSFERYLHCTLVPCVAASEPGGTPSFDEQYCCAIWISGRLPAPEALPSVRHLAICGYVSWRNAGSDAAWACLRDRGVVKGDVPFRRPAWSAPFAGRSTYCGTLTGLEELRDGCVQVCLDACSLLEVPLSMTRVTLPRLTAANPAQEASLQTYLTQILPGSATAPASGALQIKVDWTGPLNDCVRSARTGARVTVFGTGCIDGLRLARSSESVPQLKDLQPKQTTLGDLLTRLEYEVLTGLLEIDARPTRTQDAPAIAVCGPRILYPAKRYRSSVQLNGYNAWDGTSQHPPSGIAEVCDLKLAGGWVSASEGPELLAPRSALRGLYLHTADDAVKLGASLVRFSDVTLLQGNAGAAVNAGCFGILPASVSDVRAEGLHVHRICQATDTQVGGVGALIATRNVCEGVSVKGCLVADLSVPYLGGASQESVPSTLTLTRGPNMFQRVSALGFLVGGGFGGARSIESTTLEDFSLRNLYSDVVPLASGGDWHLLYRKNLGNASAQSLPGGLRGISYCDAPAGRQASVARATYLATACRVYARKFDALMADYFLCPNGGAASSGVDSYWLQGLPGLPVPTSIQFAGGVAGDSAVWPYRTATDQAATADAGVPRSICIVPALA